MAPSDLKNNPVGGAKHVLRSPQLPGAPPAQQEALAFPQPQIHSIREE